MKGKKPCELCREVIFNRASNAKYCKKCGDKSKLPFYKRVCLGCGKDMPSGDRGVCHGKYFCEFECIDLYKEKNKGRDMKNRHECLRCGYIWNSKKPLSKKPRYSVICPKCKSPYWDKERRIKKVQTR